MSFEPLDDADRALLAQVHPDDWEQPTPQGRYNMVVIGGGAGGLVTALGAAGLGGRVALIERHLLGGDCLVTGCVPSKAVLHDAHAAQRARDLNGPEVRVDGVHTDVRAVFERMRQVRSRIAPHDGAPRLRDAGVDVFLGSAAFTGPDRIEVDGTTLEYSRCCIATGARPTVPSIPGIEQARVLTSDTVFNLAEPPSRLVVLGGGPIGCELSQAFARLGIEVVLVELSDRLLAREEPEASDLVAARLRADGVQLELGRRVTRFEDGHPVLDDGRTLDIEDVLVAVGRTPNVDFAPERADIRIEAGAVWVDDHLRTSNPDVYAVGDVLGAEQFTHVAGHHAKLVLQNALFFGRTRRSDMVVPRVTYTDPEVASVGLSADAAREQGLDAWVVRSENVDRALADGEHDAYCRIWADGKGRIHGATIVGRHAGELLAPVTLAMTHGLGLKEIADTIHAYPTRSELVLKAAAAYNRTRLTPMAASALRGLLSWRR